MPIQIGGPEHAAMAGSNMQQTMSLASNAGTQPQKRTDRQVKATNASNVLCAVYAMFVFV